jgi:LacI family transcriptional regulator
LSSVRHRPTIADVADLAQVSIATVSRVLNGSAPVGEEAAARVREAVAELDYRPAAAARVLATRRTNTIGLVLSRIGGDYFAPLLRGIEAATAAAGMNLLISSGSPRSGASVAEHSTDGLLGFADSLDDDEIRRLWRREHPLVLLHRTPPDDLPIPCVTVENKAGARQLVDHLVEVHRASRIAFLRGPAGHEDSNWRELGYRESLLAHELEPDPALMGDGNFSASVAEQQVASWLAEGREMDAIFAGDDAAAVGALQALGAAGLDGRIAVVGFDDVPMAQHFSPRLTTVSAPTEQVGREAVRALLGLLRQQDGTTPLLLLPTRLIVRQSCGCPVADANDGRAAR